MRKPVEYLFIICDFDDNDRAYETCTNRRDAVRVLHGLIPVYPGKALYIRRERRA